MRYLIALEPTEAGFAVQVPDLAVVTYGPTIDAAKRAAIKAIRINLDTYEEVGQKVPAPQPVETHLNDPDYKGLLFTYVEVKESKSKAAA